MIRRSLLRHWFLGGLAAVLAAGLSAPAALEPIVQYAPRDAIVASVLFLMALPLDAGAVWQAIHRPWGVLAATAINFGLLPLFAWGVSRFLDGDLATGLLIAASVPSTMASASVWTRRAGGNDAISLMVTMLTSIACFVVTPLWLLATTGADVRGEGELARIAYELGLLAVLPIIAGQSLRAVRPIARWATRNKGALGSAAQVGILIMLLCGAVGAGEKLASQDARYALTLGDWGAMLVSVVTVHVAMLAAGYWAGIGLKLGRGDAIAIGFSGSQKTLMIGLHLAQKYFGGLSMLPMVAYHVCQLLVDAVVAERLAERQSRE